MSDNRDIGYAAVFLGSGVWSFFWGFMRLRRKRKIENIPTSTVRGLAMGLVELIGKAKKMSSIRSPLTATECVLYRYTVERYQKSGRSGHWVTIAQGDSFACPFWLEDGTGRVMILPQGAEFIMPVDFEFKTGFGKTLPDTLINFLEKNNMEPHGFTDVVPKDRPAAYATHKRSAGIPPSRCLGDIRRSATYTHLRLRTFVLRRIHRSP